MILYPDHKLKDAIKFIDNLDDSKENELIKYYILQKDNHIKEQNKLIEEYRDFFNKLNKFLPNKNSILY